MCLLVITSCLTAVEGHIADLVRRQRICPHFPAAVAHNRVFFLGHIHRHTAKNVHNVNKALKVHLDILFHRNAEVGLNGVHEKLRAAVGIGGIQPVIPIARHGEINIPHEGGQHDFLRIPVDRDNDHAVAAGDLIRPLVAANEKNMINIL